MSHAAIPFVVAASIASLAAQDVRTSLVANTPFVVSATVPSGTYSASGPAGPIPANGTLTLPAPEPYAGAIGWTTSPTGRRWRFWNNMYATYPIPSVAFLDTTLWLSAPPTRGHLRIELFSTGDFPGNPTVDVFDDGTVDAVLSTMGSSWDMAVDVHVPLHLTAAPIPVRIRLFASVPAPLYMHADIAWEPWHPSAKDFGSACTPNRIYPAHSLEDYFLAALPGTGGNAVDFVADGRGTLATFVVATDPTRLAPGLLGLGYGCDDLLLAPLLDTPGNPLGAGRWQLSVPTLPTGLLFYVQHVSLGPGYLGATNLVAYRT
ncbi:MAG: hypothetical protein JNL08_18640 [Planctomycetes bacterium]|nr:hypothetical protein [Planctomycetota bacterium]